MGVHHVHFSGYPGLECLSCEHAVEIVFFFFGVIYGMFEKLEVV